MDADGIRPDSLRKTCARLKARRATFRVLYIVPVGQNPTGCTMTLERKKALYAVAQEFDLIILEDDPYYFLQLPPFERSSSVGSGEGSEPCPALQELVPGVDKTKLIPSFLSLDTDGRVLRLESFSKLMAPGFRVGIICGPPRFVERFETLSQVTSWSISGVTQAVLFAVLQRWGDDGFAEHVKGLQATYTHRRDALMKAMDRHLGSTGLASWAVPAAGMFVWMKVEGLRDSQSLIDTMLEQAKVVMVPGSGFSPTILRSTTSVCIADFAITHIKFPLKVACSGRDAEMLFVRS